MEKYIKKIQNQAENDIDNILHYLKYHLYNYQAANNFNNNIKKAVNSSITFPYGLSKYNYNMYYIIDEKDKTIIITRILHSKMNREIYLM